MSLFQLSAASPSSCLHPSYPEITAFPSGTGRQAAEGTAMDVFCLLSNERRNVTVGLVCWSQPAKHPYMWNQHSLSNSWQTALLPRFSSLLSFSFSLSPLRRSASLQYVPLPVYFWSQTSRERPRSALPVRLSLPSPSPSIIDLT